MKTQPEEKPATWVRENQEKIKDVVNEFANEASNPHFKNEAGGESPPIVGVKKDLPYTAFMQTISDTTDTTITSGGQWSEPELLDVIKTERSVSLVYKQIRYPDWVYSGTSADGYYTEPEFRIYKEVYKATKKGTLKMKVVYGNYVPAKEETYEFD